MVELRVASVKDAKALADIYAYYVENTAVSFEYTAPSAEEFAERIEHKTEKYPFLVAVENGKCVGYAYASQLRERASYDWDAELSIYLDRDVCSKGIGTMLYGALTEILRIQNFAILYSGVTPPNVKSEALHEKFGFTKLCVTENIGYKFGKWHGVIWYQKRINYLNGEPARDILPFEKLDKRILDEILIRYSR